MLGKEAMKTDEKYKTTKGKASFIHSTTSFQASYKIKVKQDLVLVTFTISGWHKRGFKLNHHVTKKLPIDQNEVEEYSLSESMTINTRLRLA